MYDSGAKSSRGRQTSRPSREEKDLESRGTPAYSFPYIIGIATAPHFGSRGCEGSPVMRHSGVAACQRPRHATFWCRFRLRDSSQVTWRRASRTPVRRSQEAVWNCKHFPKRWRRRPASSRKRSGEPQLTAAEAIAIGVGVDGAEKRIAVMPTVEDVAQVEAEA